MREADSTSSVMQSYTVSYSDSDTEGYTSDSSHPHLGPVFVTDNELSDIIDIPDITDVTDTDEKVKCHQIIIILSVNRKEYQQVHIHATKIKSWLGA